MSRPFIDFSTSELEKKKEIYENNQDLEGLKTIAHELSFRKRIKAKTLLSEIDTILNSLNSLNSRKVTAVIPEKIVKSIQTSDFAKTLISGSTLNAYPLESGESLFIECNNTNLIFVRNGVRGLTGIINYVAT